MKRISLFIIVSIVASALSSCNRDDDSNSVLNGLNPDVAPGVKTASANNFANWGGAPSFHFYTSDNVNFSYWTLEIGNSTGYFSQTIAGIDTHWKGRISYTEKDKWCNDIIHADSLQLDITNNESGWNNVTYRTTSYTSSNGNYFTQSGSQCIYHLKTDTAGNINSISVYDSNQSYMFKFQTNTNNDFNSWKMVDLQNGWMNDQGRISLMMMPALYTVFQH